MTGAENFVLEKTCRAAVRIDRRALRLVIGGLVAASVLVPLTPAHVAGTLGETAICETSNFDPLSAYGDKINFDVHRNGKPVGYHKVSFFPSESGLRVTAVFKLEVDFLMFKAYHYYYRSESLWKDGCLVELSAETDDNGNKTTVDVRRGGDVLKIEGPAGETTAEFGIFPTDHWHPGVLRTSKVLNTIKGRVDHVTIGKEGRMAIPAGPGDRMADHYRYTGDLQNEVWYDARDRWVKMRFKAKDDSTIDYICRSCGQEQGQAS